MSVRTPDDIGSWWRDRIAQTETETDPGFAPEARGDGSAETSLAPEVRADLGLPLSMQETLATYRAQVEAAGLPWREPKSLTEAHALWEQDSVYLTLTASGEVETSYPHGSGGPCEALEGWRTLLDPWPDDMFESDPEIDTSAEPAQPVDLSPEAAQEYGPAVDIGPEAEDWSVDVDSRFFSPAGEADTVLGAPSGVNEDEAVHHREFTSETPMSGLVHTLIQILTSFFQFMKFLFSLAGMVR